jgi:hypothetical protein
MNKTTTVLLLLLIWSCGMMNAQDLINRTRNNEQIKTPRPGNGLAERVSVIPDFRAVDVFGISAQQKSQTDQRDVVYLDLAPGFFEQFTNGPIELTIPVEEDRKFELLLFPSRIQSAGYAVKDGADQIISGIRPARFYHGIVKDDPSSLVAVSTFETGIQIVISDAFGNYNLGLVRDKSKYALFKESELPPFIFNCGVDENSSLLPEPGHKSIPKEDSGQKSTGGECVKVYIEADYKTYENFDYSSAAVTDFIEGMFNVVSAIYTADNIHIEMSDLRIWTTDDPYGAETNVIGALNYLNANITSFDGDLFHLVSAIGNIGSFSGVANVYCNDPGCTITKLTALCQADPFAVSQTQLFYEELPAYSWTVNVFAHEMGHNLGSPHTHACQWGPGENSAIDGCVGTSGGCSNPGLPSPGGGTIMSYCHLIGEVGISLFHYGLKTLKWGGEF